MDSLFEGIAKLKAEKLARESQAASTPPPTAPTPTPPPAPPPAPTPPAPPRKRGAHWPLRVDSRFSMDVINLAIHSKYIARCFLRDADDITPFDRKVVRLLVAEAEKLLSALDKEVEEVKR